MDEIEVWVAEGYKGKFEDTFEQFVILCRQKQKEWAEGSGDINGIDYARQMVTDGIISTEMFIKIMPAIVEYNTPFIVNMKKK